MGHIVKIKTDGGFKYKACYEKYSLDGKRKRGSKTFPVGTPKTEVLRFISEQEVRRYAGTDKAKSLEDITLEEFEPIFWEELRKRKISPTTIEGYRSMLSGKKGIYTYFGKGAYLRKITVLMIEDYLFMFAETHSCKSTKLRYGFIRTLFNVAYKYGYAEKLDFENMEFPTDFNPKNNQSHYVWNSNELMKAIKLAYDEEEVEILGILALGGLCGLRKGEIAGQQYSPDSMALKFRRFQLRHPELPYVRLHALRHTFASVCVEAGMNMKYLQKVLGHSDFRQTIERYGSHLDSEFKKSQIAKLDSTYDAVKIG